MYTSTPSTRIQYLVAAQFSIRVDSQETTTSPKDIIFVFALGYIFVYKRIFQQPNLFSTLCPSICCHFTILFAMENGQLK